VFFTSDHGEHLGDHGRIQKGPPGLDSCVRVPLLMRWPAKFKPQRRFEMAELVDVSAPFRQIPALSGRWSSIEAQMDD
jgi:arylsulfatase A-like enzyme